MTLQLRNNVHVTGAGPATMVFAHGFGCDQNMWRLLAPAYAKRYRTILFDLVGSGASDAAAYDSAKYSSLQGYASDVLEIVREFSDAPVIFVGHSVSAMIGMLADLQDPGRFAAQIMIGPSPCYINDGDYEGGFTRGDIESLLETLEGNYLGWSSNMAPAIMGAPDQPELGKELTNSFCRTDPEIAKQFARVTFLSDTRADLPLLSTPTLIVQCNDDIIAPVAVGDYLHRQLPHSTLSIIDNVGHCPHLSAPVQSPRRSIRFSRRKACKGLANDGKDPPEAAALLDHAACGLLQTAADGTFLRVNRAFCSWIGRSAEALVGRLRFQDLLTMGGRIFHQTHWAPLLQMQGSISEVKLEVVHADGSAIPMVLNAIRRQEHGLTVHELAAFIARDRDKYERELIQSRKRLEELVAESARLQAEAKDRALFAEQMIGIVSHDLRNPLSSIQMGAHLLSQSDPSHGQQRILTRVQRSADRANRLIADLLDFTQARLGNGLAVKREAINLHEAVGETVDELEAVYPGRRLKHVRVGEGSCLADANRLSQLVGNLVSNAMVYGSAEKPVTVTSTIEASSFSIEVHNEGAPIPSHAQEALFRPMARGTNASSAGRSVGLVCSS